MGFLAELRCRNVIRVAGLQLAGAWLLTEVAGTLLPVFGAPDWAVQAAATSHQFPAAGRAKSHGSWPLRVDRGLAASVYGPHPTLLALRFLATRYDCSRISGLCLTSISRGRATMGYARVGSSLLCRASRPWTFAGYSDAGSTCSPSFGVLATAVMFSSISQDARAQAATCSGS